jgi:hypothetical protein
VVLIDNATSAGPLVLSPTGHAKHSSARKLGTDKDLASILLDRLMKTLPAEYTQNQSPSYGHVLSKVFKYVTDGMWAVPILVLVFF